MSGIELFKKLYERKNLNSLAFLTAVIWFFSTIIFSLFEVKNISLKICIPLITSLIIAWVREDQNSNEPPRKLVFAIFANGIILFFCTVMLSKTLSFLGKLPPIELYSQKYKVLQKIPTGNSETSKSKNNEIIFLNFWYNKTENVDPQR